MVPLVSCRVEFAGEDGVDQGGVTRELFSIAFKEIVKKTSLLSPCGNMGEYLWFTRNAGAALSRSATSGHAFDDTLCDEFMLGVLVGLAVHNRVLVDLPLVPVVYKLLNGQKVHYFCAVSSSTYLYTKGCLEHGRFDWCGYWACKRSRDFVPL